MSEGIDLMNAGGIIPPPIAGSGGGGWQLQASTPVAGMPTSAVAGFVFATWNVPNDGKLHTFIVATTKTVQAAETQGYIQVYFTAPDGTSCAYTVVTGQQGTGFTTSSQTFPFVCQPGSTVQVRQFSPLTLGASTVWIQIWGL